ncbi:MAG: hypothetical protein DLM54_02165 [Acidimicrobiales bacterium]|nr:MAG: hypothetical protein DLM54_02165 [Acidimicrobiales bacterium]
MSGDLQGGAGGPTGGPGRDWSLYPSPRDQGIRRSSTSQRITATETPATSLIYPPSGPSRASGEAGCGPPTRCGRSSDETRSAGLIEVLLDAYALLAVLRDEPAADEVLTILAGPGPAISSLNAAEVLDRHCRAGASEEEAETDLAGLGAEVVHPSAGVILSAGVLRGRRHHRTDRPVSLADCVAAAHALALEVPLATSDSPWAQVATAEWGQVHPFPDWTGALDAGVLPQPGWREKPWRQPFPPSDAARRCISSGATSSTWVWMLHTCPKGSSI